MIPNAYVWYLDKKTMNEIKDGLCLSFNIFLIRVFRKVKQELSNMSNILEQKGTGNNIQVKSLALWVYAENGSLHHFNILHFQSYKSNVSGPTV